MADQPTDQLELGALVAESLESERRGDRPELLTSAFMQIARLAARLGDHEKLRYGLRGVLRTLKRHDLMTSELRKEIDQLKAVASQIEVPAESDEESVQLPGDGRERRELIDEMLREVRDVLSNRASREASIDLTRSLLDWTQALAAEGEDREALRCADGAARIAIHEDEVAEAEAQTWIARLAARMGDDVALRGARSALKRLRAYTDELHGELDAIKAAANACLPPSTDPAAPSAYLHPRFGRGVLVRREGDKLHLRFEDGVVRAILARFVHPA